MLRDTKYMVCSLHNMDFLFLLGEKKGCSEECTGEVLNFVWLSPSQNISSNRKEESWVLRKLKAGDGKIRVSFFR